MSGAMAHAATSTSMAGKKTKCIHPDRPVAKACADCPRRKGRFAPAGAATNDAQGWMVMAKKEKCIHPDRPRDKACADCPNK